MLYLMMKHNFACISCSFWSDRKKKNSSPWSCPFSSDRIDYWNISHGLQHLIIVEHQFFNLCMFSNKTVFPLSPQHTVKSHNNEKCSNQAAHRIYFRFLRMNYFGSIDEGKCENSKMEREKECLCSSVYLPKWSRTAKAIAENIATVMTWSGLNMAAKTGPLRLMHHACR